MGVEQVLQRNNDFRQTFSVRFSLTSHALDLGFMCQANTGARSGANAPAPTIGTLREIQGVRRWRAKHSDGLTIVVSRYLYLACARWPSIGEMP